MTKIRIAGMLLMALFSISAAAQTPATKANAAKANAAKASAAKASAAKTDTKAAAPQGKTLYQKTLFDHILKQQTTQTPDSPELRENLHQQLNTRELLLKEARKAGIDKLADNKMDMQISSEMVLISAYLADWHKKNPPSEDLLKKEYDALKAQLGDKEYKLAHILVDGEAEAEAKAIIADLKKGAKFADIAKEKSKDVGSKENGGDLGWNYPIHFTKPFADALPTIEKGTFTETPVQSQFGWHIILVEDIRDTNLPGFEEAKPQLQPRVQKQMLDVHINSLREKAGV